MNLSEKYISEYKDGFVFEFCERFVCSAFDVNIEIHVLESKQDNSYREKAKVILKNREQEYRCELCDSHNYETMFYPVILDGKRLILFRKTLYGFTLINADSLGTEYEYFPEKVFDGGESFIITDTSQMGELLIFEGCYWACGYEFFAFDYNRKLFLRLSELCGMTCTDNAVISGDKLSIQGRNKNNEAVKVTLTTEEILRAMTKIGKTDF